MSYGKDSKEVLENAERYQRLFVQPLVDAVRVEMQTHLAPLVEQVRAHDTRLVVLEGSQRKALIGWGVYASIAAVALGSLWTWIKSRLHWG